MCLVFIFFMSQMKKCIISEAFRAIISDSQNIHQVKLIFKAYKKTNKKFSYFYIYKNDK